MTNQASGGASNNNGHIGTVKVEQLMTAGVYTIIPTTTVREAIQLLLSKKISGAPVVDASQKVISVISESDLMKFAAQGELDVPISKKLDKLVATDKLICVRTQDTFVEVFRLFLTNRVRRVLVIDGVGKIQGIISRSNILRVFMEQQA